MKKLISIITAFAVVIAMAGFMPIKANAWDKIGNDYISIALDYDQLENFNTSHTGKEVSAEILEKMEVQSQQYHTIEGAALVYFVSGTNAYMPVGDTTLNRNTQYYITFTVSYENRVSKAKAIRYNGIELTEVSSKPVLGQYAYAQPTTVNQKTCDVFRIPVEAKPKYDGPNPYLNQTEYVYTGSPITNGVKNYNPDIQYIDSASVTTATDVGTYSAIVKLMDKSVYCFYDGTVNDKVLTWKIVPAPQTISTAADSFSKAYGASVFDLGASANTALSYKSSNSKVVAVSSDGKVTVKGVGSADITITAAEGNYEKASKKVKVTVNPKKAAVSSATVGKNQVTVKMGTKVSSTGGTKYQIQYRVKGTSTWKTKTTTSQTYTIKSLKKGKKYQIKVRAYKDSYYGEYSAIKTTKAVK